MKRKISLVLVLSLIITMFSFQTPLSVNAAYYNPEEAMIYAAAHWNDGVGLCAEFVSKCVIAGGLNMGVKAGTGDCHRAIAAASGAALQDLIINSQGQATYADNGHILARGDAVFQWCYTHNISPHVMICSGYNQYGNPTFYAHNGAMNNATYNLAVNTSYQHTRSCNMGAKVIHLSDSQGVYTPDEPEYTVTECRFNVTVPANYLVQGYETPTSTKKYRKFDPQSSSYVLGCTKKLVFRNGNVRYFVTDSSGNGIYFDFTSGLSVVDNHRYTNNYYDDPAHPHYRYKVCDYCGYLELLFTMGYSETCTECNPPETKTEETPPASETPGSTNVYLPPSAKITDVQLSDSSLTMHVGDTYKLSVTLSPSTAPLNTIFWKSSDTSIVDVTQSGKIKALKSGTATITAYDSFTEIYDKCKIKVQADDVYSNVDVKFNDVSKNSYYYDSVRWAVGKKITTGVTNTHFKPDDLCTRANIITFLWRADGEPSNNLRYKPYKDVLSADYFYDAFNWAAENEITDTDNKSIQPDTPCTRAEAVMYIWRSKGMPIAKKAVKFSDVSKNSEYYDAVCWAVEAGVTTGTDSTHFSPDKTCTRAQIMTFLYRVK